MFSKEATLKYIKKTPVQIFNHYLIYNKWKIKKICENYRIFIFHALTNNELYILKSLPMNSKVVWLGWGFDYYDLIEKEQLKPLTRSIQHAETNTMFKRLKSGILRVLLNPPNKITLLKKVDYISVFYDEYLLLKSSIPNFKPKHIFWNYGSLEDDLVRSLDDLQVNGNNILLGNSANIANNHLDAFHLLKELDIKDRLIITPLSYGDEYYRNIIINHGKSFFGDKFLPVVNYMPINDYIDMISTCSIVIMNHLRQQAVGNIVIMLYLGAKVFLDPDNIVYSFFHGQGAWIYTLDELNSELDSQLSINQIEQNRSVLRKNWGREVILKKTKDLLFLIDNE